MPNTVQADERARLWLQRWKECKTYYGPRNQLRGQELEFAQRAIHFKGQREMMDDPAFVQFIGRELFSKIRRISADVMNSVVNEISAEPQDDQQDRYTAADAAWALKKDLRDPNKGFKTYLLRAVIGAASAREWWLTVDWEPGVGQFGEVCFGTERPDRMYLCPPYQDVWDMRLPWLVRERQVSLEWARAKFNAPDLVPDSMASDDMASSMSIDAQGQVTFGGGSSAENFGESVTLLYCWSQFDETKQEVSAERVLPKGKEYFWCPECQHKAPMAPEDGMCPFCAIERGAPVQMQFVDREQLTMEQLAYKRGKRLEIVAAKSGKVLNPGNQAWPAPEAGFPFCKIVRYEDPIETSGLSETKLDGPLQVISDVTMQKAYEQAFMAPNVILFSGPGKPTNADGTPFQMSNEPWQTAFIDDIGTSAQQFRAEPVWNALAQFWGSVQQAFRADLGVVELGSAQQNPRGTAGVTVDKLIESGSVPTDHWISQIREWLCAFFSVVSAYQRRFWTEARWVRMKGPTGSLAFKRISGADIPGADFTISSDRSHKVVEAQEAQAIIQWAQLPEPLRSLLAPKFGIDPEFADTFKQATEEQQQNVDANIVAKIAQHIGFDPNEMVSMFMEGKRAMASMAPAGGMGSPGSPGVSGGPGSANGSPNGLQFAQ